jgi:glycosyltransferase involved in cell wall biosynthesis
MRIHLLVSNEIRYDQRMIRVASSLQDAGYQILLIGRKKKDSFVLPSYVFKTLLLNCYFKSGVLFYLELNLRLFKFLSVNEADAVYAVDFDTLPASYLYHLFYSKPFVFDSHEFFTEVPELQHHPIKKWIWEIVGKKIIPKATFSITVSESLANILSEKYKVAFTTIRNLPTYKTIEFADILQRRKNKWVYYQGMLHKGRGIELLIQTMIFLPEWTLILAGEGDKSEELKSLTHYLGLEKRVIFKGMVEPSDLIHLAKEAWISINILENSSLSYYYSLANKTFDYFQAWLPAIHIDFPEYRLLAKENKSICLLDKMDPKRLAQMIEDLWMDQAFYESMVASAAEAAKQYTWEKESKKLLKLFNIYFPLTKDMLQK